ncbi:MAG: hypothetical protein CL526_04280 [Aequorivita sp.]|nr:hypothetical protein [Aequorivita sp.]|tara:strand:- start:39842 stop:42100 length:2259 start_codon:yes stop_codon:yes gene_type:complete
MNKKLLHYSQSCSLHLKDNFGRQALLLFSFLFLSFSAMAQGPGCPNVNAGPDVEIDCGDPCVDLTASFLDTGETTSYEVTSIPFDPPFPFTGGTPVSVNTDDVWSPAIPLPFDFCFFGETYSEMVIGSNAVISFDLTNNPPNGYCSWSFDESIPDPNLFFTTIFGPYMDINPAVTGSGQINYAVFGDAPCRTMVVNFPGIPYFGSACSGLDLTSQVVIYETTNVIEVYVENRPAGCSWNDGNAVLGIQNQDGTLGYTPPGRNTGDWSATDEAWRFTPNGASNVVFSWLDSNGDVIGTDPTINVCPTDPTTTYTAQAVYTNCNGDIITETDEVVVTRVDGFTVDLGPDQELCEAQSYDITAEITGGNPADATFLWNTGETTQTITVTTSGTYTVDVTIGTCTVTESVDINFNELPVIELGDNIETCFDVPVILDASPSNYNPADATYEWSLDGVVIAGETNPTLTVTQYGMYSVVVNVSDCEATDELTVAQAPLAVSLGDDFTTCFENTVTLTAEAIDFDPTNATFEWSLDGVVIAGETSSTLEITEIGVYTVTATLGSCTATDSVEVSFRDDLEVSLGADFQTCPNEPQTLTATTTEEGATYQWYLNGTLLANETNSTLEFSVEVGTVGTQTYTVVMSVGGCSGEDSIDIMLYDVGQCVISEGLSPNGDGYNDNLDLTFLNDRTGIRKLQIFNRLGTLVYEQNNYTNQWRGQDKDSNDLTTGTYFYVIDFVGTDAVYGAQATGWIYLNQEAN